MKYSEQLMKKAERDKMRSKKKKARVLRQARDILVELVPEVEMMKKIL